MPHTSDNDKKAKDNHAKQAEKNVTKANNTHEVKNSFSKEVDHL